MGMGPSGFPPDRGLSVVVPSPHPPHVPPRSVCAGGSWRCAEAPCPPSALCPGGLLHAPGSCLRRCDGTEPNGTCASFTDGCVCPPGTVFLVRDTPPQGGAGGQGSWTWWALGLGKVGAGELDVGLWGLGELGVWQGGLGGLGVWGR